MKLTKQKAIKETKKLWDRIKELEMSKREFLRTFEGQDWSQRYRYACPCCEFARRDEDNLEESFQKNWRDTCAVEGRVCPLVEQYGKNCYELGFEDENLARFFAVVESLEEEEEPEIPDLTVTLVLNYREAQWMKRVLGRGAEFTGELQELNQLPKLGREESWHVIQYNLYEKTKSFFLEVE